MAQDHAALQALAALPCLFADGPGPDEALRLLSEPDGSPLPEGLSVLLDLYGYDVPEPAPAPGR